MKGLAFFVGLVALLLTVAVFAQTVASRTDANEWTLEQRDVLNVFQKYIDAALRNNLKEMSTFWHPRLVAWDLGEKSPMNYDEFEKSEGTFFKDYKFKKLTFEPLSIQVEDNTAIIHLRYDMAVVDHAGNETPDSGNWTAVLAKKDKKWVILSNVWKSK